MHAQQRDKEGLKIGRWTDVNKNKAGLAVLTLDKVDFEVKTCDVKKKSKNCKEDQS